MTHSICFTGFGKQIVSDFLAKFDLDLVCRAHMVVEEGYEFFNDRTLVTIFSAPNYCGEFGMLWFGFSRLAPLFPFLTKLLLFVDNKGYVWSSVVLGVCIVARDCIVAGEKRFCLLKFFGCCAFSIYENQSGHVWYVSKPPFVPSAKSYINFDILSSINSQRRSAMLIRDPTTEHQRPQRIEGEAKSFATVA